MDKKKRTKRNHTLTKKNNNNMQADLSSKMRKLCLAASSPKRDPKSGVKSSRMSTWVFTAHRCGPVLSTN